MMKYYISVSLMGTAFMDSFLTKIIILFIRQATLSYSKKGIIPISIQENGSFGTSKNPRPL